MPVVKIAHNNCQLTHYCKIYSVVDALRYTIPNWCSPVINTTESNYGVCVSEVGVCQNRRDFSREHIASSLSTKKLCALQMLLVSKLDAGAIKDGELVCRQGMICCKGCTNVIVGWT